LLALGSGLAVLGGSVAQASEKAEACFAELRGTEDGQRLEAFLRGVQRDLGTAGALLGEESLVLRRMVDAAEAGAGEGSHERLHLALGGRLDEGTHGAMHSLMGQMQACLHGGP
jgi:hypothetical protein